MGTLSVASCHVMFCLQRVHLHFKSFDVETADGDCSFDSVKVYSGDSDKAPLQNTFCGDDLPGDVTSAGNSLFISFLSDRSKTGGGFSVEYKTKTVVTGE